MRPTRLELAVARHTVAVQWNGLLYAKSNRLHSHICCIECWEAIADVFVDLHMQRSSKSIWHWHASAGDRVSFNPLGQQALMLSY